MKKKVTIKFIPMDERERQDWNYQVVDAKGTRRGNLYIFQAYFEGDHSSCVRFVDSSPELELDKSN